MASRTGHFFERIAPLASGITLLAALVTVIQLGLAIVSARDTQRIAESVSTRFIDNFPRNIPALVKLVETARDTIVICADYAGYGEFSNREGFEDYRHALTKAVAAKVKVNMFLYDEAAMREALKRQFPDEVDSFFQKEIDRELAIRNEFKNSGITITDVHTDLPVFLWLVDGREAIFSFHVFRSAPGDSFREAAFRTLDARFVEVLRLKTDSLTSPPQPEPVPAVQAVPPDAVSTGDVGARIMAGQEGTPMPSL